MMARLPGCRHDVARATPGGAFHEQSVRRLAKVQARAHRLQAQLDEALGATDASALRQAERDLAKRRAARPARSSPTRPAKGVPQSSKKPSAALAKPTAARVTVRRTAPAAARGPVCRACGVWAPLHTTAGWCGACLRRSQEQCSRCGTWQTPKEALRHRCGAERSNSVTALQGGAPGLGRRH